MQTTGTIVTKNQISKAFMECLDKEWDRANDVAKNPLDNIEYFNKAGKNYLKLVSKEYLHSSDKITGFKSECAISLSPNKQFVIVDVIIDCTRTILPVGDGSYTFKNSKEKVMYGALKALEEAIISQRKKLKLTKVKLKAVLRSLQEAIQSIILIQLLRDDLQLSCFVGEEAA